MPEMDSIPFRVADVLSNLFHETVDPSKDQALLDKDYGPKSMDLVDIAEALEPDFSIKVANADIEHLRSFDDVVAYVKNKAPIKN
jgi:acyl carrier protein